MFILYIYQTSLSICIVICCNSFIYRVLYGPEPKKTLAFQIGCSKENAIKTLLSVAIKRGVSVVGRFRFYYLPRKTHYLSRDLNPAQQQQYNNNIWIMEYVTMRNQQQQQRHHHHNDDYDKNNFLGHVKSSTIVYYEG